MEGYLGEEVLTSYEGTPYEGFAEKEWALEYLYRYGTIDGDHHKQWLNDQIARILNETPVILSIARWKNGHFEYRYNTGEPSQKYLNWLTKAKGEQDEDGDYEYSWEEGIAP